MTILARIFPRCRPQSETVRPLTPREPPPFQRTYIGRGKGLPPEPVDVRKPGLVIEPPLRSYKPIEIPEADEAMELIPVADWVEP